MAINRKSNGAVIFYPLALLLTTLLAVLSASQVWATDVEGVRVWRAPDHTRVVLDLSDAATFKHFTLNNPERVVVDIQSAKLKAKLKKLDLSRSPIKKIRAAKRNKNDLRLVFDLSEKVEPNTFLLSANQQYGDRLVIDLYDRKAKPTAVKTASNNNGKRDIIVAIDAGHGGEDPGALGPRKTHEKVVVLSIAREAKRLLDQKPGYRGVLVRDGDYYVGLGKRREIARKKQADLFISIHADAFTDKSVSGGSVYTLSQRGASSASAKFLAESENSTDLIGGVALSDKDDVLASVLLDLSMTAKLDHSVLVGKEILREMKGVTKLHKNTVEHAGFAVLKTPDIPSVLVETGFISNPKEARRLVSSSHQKKLAGAIVRGTTAFFNKHAVEGTMVYWLNHGGNQSLAASSSAGSRKTYKIKSGDTLSELANRFSVSLSDLRRYNSLANDRILVGQVLRIPPRS
ncbi:N-acetylmuramoyl-L-alanine amidase [Pseudomonadales bacterium]|nr:N-acetylmuramoyl-L-alanine amidase [Pseudomonadales bacterium]